MERFDVGVIGLGMIGSGALGHLTRLLPGASIVGIGPAEPARFADHSGAFASHIDSGRITRVLDQRLEWALLARRAIARYGEIETASGIAFHRPVGLRYSTDDAVELDDCLEVAARLGLPLARQGAEESARVEPRYRVDAGATVLVEAAPAGHIDPLRCIAAQLAAASAAGATVRRHEATRLARSAGGWRVELAGSSIEVGRLVVAAGPHGDELDGLPARPDLRVHAATIVMAHLGRAEQSRLAGLPSAILPYRTNDRRGTYIVAPTIYPDGSVRLKLGAEQVTPPPLDTAAERRAWMRSDRHLGELADLRTAVETLVPGIVAERWETRPCLISETPTGLPYVDAIADGLVVAVGGNGFAAKSGDAIGALAARRLVEGRWSDDELNEDDFRMREAR